MLVYLTGADGDSSACKTVRVTSMFENRLIKLAAPVKEDGTVTFVDSLRGFATAAFRIECNNLDVTVTDDDNSHSTTTGAAVAAAAANLVYNPSYEIAVNPAVPDGNYVTQPADEYGGGFFFTEYRDSTEGRASLRLTAPAAGGGMTLAPYTVPKVEASHGYTFSVWVKGTCSVQC
jgi:hypothetical protein